MFGRKKEVKGQATQEESEVSTADIQEQPTNEDNQATTLRPDPDGEQPQETAVYFTRSSGMSLDGRSFVVPTDREFDDVSSINTAQFGYGHEMRIVGSLADEENAGYVRPLEESPITQDTKKQQPSYEFHSACPKRDDKSLGTAGTFDMGWLPLWITDAPKWLKIVIVLSTALLVGAIVLIGVGAALAVQTNRAESMSSTVTPPAPIPTPVDTKPPVTSKPPVPAPTMSTNDGAATVSPTEATGEQDDVPAPASTPTLPSVTTPEQSSPSLVPTNSSISFFATGGRFTGDALAALPQQLKTLPLFDENAVLFHLGDWNSPYATSCVEQSYQDNVNLYSNSAVPVYFVPGDNEYNGMFYSSSMVCIDEFSRLTCPPDCPDPDQAFAFWKQYLLDYETEFWPPPTAWNITRQEPDYAENFAYVYNRALFVGIDLVGGTVHDNAEWQNRLQADLQWIDDQYALNEGTIDMLVILAHADPDIQANSNFFAGLYDRVQLNYNLPVVFVHRNLGVESWALETQFNGLDNLTVVVVEGSIWPPMLIQIDTKAGTVDIDQGQWYENYISSIA